MVPLQQAGLLTNDDKAKLFSNVELILGVNETILKQLEERAKDWSFATCLGDVFLALVHDTTHDTRHTTRATQDSLARVSLMVCRVPCAACR